MKFRTVLLSIALAAGMPSLLLADVPYPIIFVHGLVSDYRTWAGMTDDIRDRAHLLDPIVYHVCLNHDMVGLENPDEADLTSWFERDDNGGGDVVPVGWTDMEGREVLRNIENYRNGRLFVINFNDDRIEEIRELEHGDHHHSNQAAIYKQGFALKLMIQQVIDLTGAQKVILVGHSMGGLAIREYLQRVEDDAHIWWVNPNDNEFGHKVAKVVTLGTPHLGFDGEWWVPGQMERDDAWWENNERLESLRDMRSGYWEDNQLAIPGIYLFGGRESWINSDEFADRHVDYRNVNVNSNRDEEGEEIVTDYINGLDELIGEGENPENGTVDNPDMPLPYGIEYVWMRFQYLDFNGDGIVYLNNQWLHEGDAPRPASRARYIDANNHHINEPGNVPAIMRGLDEPGDQEFCCILSEERLQGGWLYGFVTESTDDDPDQPDSDRYKFVSEEDGIAYFDIDLGSVQTLDSWSAKILNSNDQELATMSRADHPQDGRISCEVRQGMTYYAYFLAEPTDVSYRTPYKFRVGTYEDDERNIVWTRHIVVRGWTNGYLAVGDVDQDGDNDLIGGSELDGNNYVGWWENDNVVHFRWHQVYQSQGEPRMRQPVLDDLDQDGDIDIVSGKWQNAGAARWSWLENNGEQSFEENIMSEEDLQYLAIHDFDLDGDQDILGAQTPFNANLAWWENDGEQNFAKHYIAGIERIKPFTALDFDDDGDQDVIYCDVDDVVLWQNDSHGNFQRNLIANNLNDPYHASAADIDSDGDNDVICGSQNNGDILWIEHDTNEQHLIDGNYSNPKYVSGSDIDDDGDVDVIAASSTADDVAWWENLDHGNVWRKHSIDVDFDGAHIVFANDMDNDGDPDIAAYATGSDMVVWYENHLRDPQHENELGRTILTDGIYLSPDQIYVSREESFRASFTISNLGEGNLTNIRLTAAVLNQNGEHQFDLETLELDGLEINEEFEYGLEAGYILAPGRYSIVARVRIDGQWSDIQSEGRASNPVVFQVLPRLVHFEPSDNTGSNHSLIVTSSTIDGDDLSTGDEIGVFTPDGLCAGADVWLGEQIGLAAWGDDDQSEEIEGFREGELFAFRVWDYIQRAEFAADAEYSQGEAHYETNGLSVLTLTASSVFNHPIALVRGWNMISTNVQPQDIDIRVLMRELVGREHLVFLKDGIGRFYSPEHDFLNIPRWSTSEGYQLKASEVDTLTMRGLRIPFDSPLPLAQGWQIVAYYPTWPLDVQVVFDEIVENLLLVKDNNGRFYYPALGFSNMGMMRPGKGYQVKMSAAADLIYPTNERAASEEPEGTFPVYFTPPAPTGTNMSLLLTDLDRGEISENDEIAVFSRLGRLVGVGIVTEGTCGLAVWGDDQSTDLVDGLQAGESFTLKLWNAHKDVLDDLQVSSKSPGDGLVYKTDGITVANATLAKTIPDDFYLGQTYPNPFNAVTRFTFGLPKDSHVSVRVFDMAGHEVVTLVNGQLEAGTHAVSWNGEGFTSGVYLVKMETPRFTKTNKMALVK